MAALKSNNAKELKFCLTIRRQKNFYISQAAILRACRVVANLTQREAADKLEVSASTLCGWEKRGCRDLAHCARMADIYKQSIDIFVPSTYGV